MKRISFSAVPGWGLFTMILLVLLSTACSQPRHLSADNDLKPLVMAPQINIVDYLAVDCERIWQIDDEKSMKNPLYWMRGIDCAIRLSPAAARAEAKNWPADRWQHAFKQGVLLDNGNVTPVERNQYMGQLDRFSVDYPLSIRPLLQLWRNNQAAQLDLSETRTRYHHLQQTSDSELDTLRQHQAVLKRELAETRRKLATLTDIERQLSSRKSPDVSENSHSGDNTHSPVVIPVNEPDVPATRVKGMGTKEETAQ